tara:strand:+ start:1210 stop:2175 length:966 start_codon:yes stop_codon:yes gene_type:complete
MNSKPILIVAGEPNSIFLEIFFKSLKKNNFKKTLILIGSLKLLKLQMKKLNYKSEIRLLEVNKLKNYKLNNLSINLINVEYTQKKAFEKISKKANLYVEKSFKLAIKLLKNGYSDKLINGPISKKTFLNKKYPGITEYLTKKFFVKKSAMLIYNKELSVCPVTTHLPLKLVTKKINKKIISDKIKLINSFYKKKFSIIPRIAILGVNPHCESILKQNEDDIIIKPLIKKLTKSDFNVSGPHSADTIFLKKNRTKYDVIVGMYHDQVLTPIKTIFEYDAINITLGLPFIRISPDHGPNEKMIGKNLSNPLSLIKAIKFMEKN